MNSQLGFTKDSWTYLTPEGNYTSLQAQISLLLPQSNTANSLIQVKPNSIYPNNMIMQRGVTGNVYMRGGGGYEIIHMGVVNSKYLIKMKWEKMKRL